MTVQLSCLFFKMAAVCHLGFVEGIFGSYMP